MYIKANTGAVVPREDNFHRYITNSEIVQVESTAYYVRSIAAGDLVECSQAEYDAQQQALVDADIANEKAAKKQAKGAELGN